MATNWVSNSIIDLSAPPVIQGIGFGTYLSLACWCSLTAVSGYFLVPETSKPTFGQIDTLFKDGTDEEESQSDIKAQVAQDLRA